MTTSPRTRKSFTSGRETRMRIGRFYHLQMPPQEEAQPEYESSTNASREHLYNSSRVEQSDESFGPSPPLEDEPTVRDETTSSAQQPLPDLTQGIPSTLDAELRAARSRKQGSTSSLNITEDPSEPIPSSGGRGLDNLPKSAYISSSEKKKNNIIKYAYLVMGGGLIGYIVYLGRNWESEELAHNHPEAPSGWGIGLFWNRVKARLSATLDYYNEPAFPTLLPKHDPNMQPPMTLVLSLEDLMVHQEWTRERGWRIAKRPGVDYFLRYLSQYYELVLFTTQPSSMADQVIRKLDPYRIIQWPLFREATLYKDGGYVKVWQLQCLGYSADMTCRTCLTSIETSQRSCCSTPTRDTRETNRKTRSSFPNGLETHSTKPLFSLYHSSNTSPPWDSMIPERFSSLLRENLYL